MKFEKDKAVAFTGYRTAKILKTSNNPHLIDEINSNLEKHILALHEEGYDTFISGMSEGFDLLSAGAVIRVRMKHPQIKLLIAIPFMGQELSYSPQDKQLYDIIYQLANKVVLISDDYHERAFLDRNDFMLNNSSAIICYYDGQRGGTMYTYNRAVKSDMKIINLCNYPTV